VLYKAKHKTATRLKIVARRHLKAMGDIFETPCQDKNSTTFKNRPAYLHKYPYLHYQRRESACAPPQTNVRFILDMLTNALFFETTGGKEIIAN